MVSVTGVAKNRPVPVMSFYAEHLAVSGIMIKFRIGTEDVDRFKWQYQ